MFLFGLVRLGSQRFDQMLNSLTDSNHIDPSRILSSVRMIMCWKFRNRLVYQTIREIDVLCLRSAHTAVLSQLYVVSLSYQANSELIVSYLMHVCKLSMSVHHYCTSTYLTHYITTHINSSTCIFFSYHDVDF